MALLRSRSVDSFLSELLFAPLRTLKIGAQPNFSSLVSRCSRKVFVHSRSSSLGPLRNLKEPPKFGMKDEGLLSYRACSAQQAAQELGFLPQWGLFGPIEPRKGSYFVGNFRMIWIKDSYICLTSPEFATNWLYLFARHHFRARGLFQSPFYLDLMTHEGL